MAMKIFAVDFDGTLSFGQWSECGPGNDRLIEFMKNRKKNGDRIILWACREGADRSAAVDWCVDNGLLFDTVKDNLPEVIEKYGVNSRKVSCDFYIDDRSISGNVYRLVEGCYGYRI